MAKKSTKTQKKHFLDSKEKMIKAGIVTGVILVFVFILMFIETGDSKLIVKNSTDLKVEYVKTKFVKEEEDLDITKYIKTKSIDANKSYTMKTKPISLLNLKATSNICFKFKGHKEMTIDSGYFNENFDGITRITFKKTDDPNKLEMTVRASNGILPSKLTQCNDVFTVDLSTGRVFD